MRREQLGRRAFGFPAVLGADAATDESLRPFGERHHAETERHAQLHVALQEVDRCEFQLAGAHHAFHDLTSSLHILDGAPMGSQEPKWLQTAWYYVPSALVMLGLLLFWQFAVDFWQIKEYIVPSPWAAIKTLSQPNYQWTVNFLTTLYPVLGAFALSAVLGVVIAVVIVWNDLLMRTIMPVLVLFNTLPKIALAPLFVVWLGYGVWANILIGTTLAFFPIVVNTAVGLATAEPEMLELVRSLRASRWQVFMKIRFPHALPYIFTGLKLNATMSVIGAIVGEFVASERGLGALIITGGVTLQTPSIFASLGLISVLGLVLYGIVVAVEQLVAPWD